MTGFATAQCSSAQASGAVIQATVTIRTLNSKFFEASCKLPYALAPLEQAMMSRCKEAFKRGSVTITVHVTNPTALRVPSIPPAALVAHYVDALKTIQREHGLTGSITIADIIAIPHLFEVMDEPVDKKAQEEIMKAVDGLITTVLAMRLEEGAALQRDLEQRMEVITQEVERIAPRAEAVAQERTERLLQAISATLLEMPDELREMHIQSLYGNVHTIEVHEEIVRMRAHIAQFKATLADGESLKGKKLDFILQELFREINTVASKLADFHSMHAIITVKSELERAREQVQNIV